MRLISSLALATVVLAGCAQPTAPKLTSLEMAAAVKEIESRPAPTPDEVRRFAYMERSLPMCVRMLPSMPGLKEVKVSEGYDYCTCVHSAGAKGLTAADLDEMSTPGSDGKYATDKGLALMNESIKRANAAIPECRARTLSKY
ncbi:hypothetical protein J2W23_003795 [Variovorax boronicumulans]|uniref:hypothetical protein n=1 Tax=Variovorax boronicumulans TaxID=436515 RepID=UPI00277F1F01|nr:hypothetical protein [Variovorax boronicumulans]MDQ0015395.1 hypothetical protein [Variovorax boronicumulans]